jgi:hypothetical protein
MCRRKYNDAPGRLVLQDLPVVIDAIKDLDPKIERMNHDFHTEQPVKGTSHLLSTPPHLPTQPRPHKLTHP